MTIRNRVVVPPMASQTADTHGLATDATVAHYRRLAESGAGLIIAEYSYVHRTGRGEANQLGVDSDANIAGLEKIAAAIHGSSSLAGLQLVHVGGKSSAQLTGGSLMGPSAIPVPVKGWTPDVPIPMTKKDIDQWIEWFATAAARAARAGFDLVELHAAHGYGLNQWLSPLTNGRDDQFGGSIVGRSRLLLQIVGRIKAQTPHTLLSVRIPAHDHLEGGLTPTEMNWVVAQLKTHGVDIINVSSGIGGWRRPEGRAGQGYLVSDAALIKAQTSLPVIGVGGIESGQFIDDALQGLRLDFAAVGRAILADPAAWARSHAQSPTLWPPDRTGIIRGLEARRDRASRQALEDMGKLYSTNDSLN